MCRYLAGGPSWAVRLFIEPPVGTPVPLDNSREVRLGLVERQTLVLGARGTYPGPQPLPLRHPVAHDLVHFEIHFVLIRRGNNREVQIVEMPDHFSHQVDRERW